MTSYREPDFYAKLKLTRREINALSGTAFSVSIIQVDPGNSYKGMIIIPQGNNKQNDSDTYESWLWINEATDLSDTANVQIEIKSPCDPMLPPAEVKKLIKHKGLVLMGIINSKF